MRKIKPEESYKATPTLSTRLTPPPPPTKGFLASLFFSKTRPHTVVVFSFFLLFFAIIILFGLVTHPSYVLPYIANQYILASIDCIAIYIITVPWAHPVYIYNYST